MPSVSQKQRAFLFAKKGPEWVKAHHFDNPGKLPKYAHKKRRKKIGMPKKDSRGFY